MREESGGPFCGCGFMMLDTEKQRHAVRHREWEEGIRLAPSIGNDASDTLVIPADPSMPYVERNLAYRMGRVAQRSQHWGVNSSEWPVSKNRRSPDWDEHRTTAFLAVRAGMAVGYLVIRLRDDLLRVNMKRKETIEEARITTPIPCCDAVFVCKSKRRMGIASELVRYVADYYELMPTRMAWRLPLSGAGERLALSFNADGMAWLG